MFLQETIGKILYTKQDYLSIMIYLFLGGSDKSKCGLNMGYLDNSGMLKYTNYERYSARLNFKLFNDKVEFGVLNSYVRQRLAVGNAPTPGLAITLANDSSLYCVW
jgi:hypothetical protein